MNNAMEGANYATKKSDMSAMPKDNIDTAANTMQNHFNMKLLSRKNALARDLNAEPLELYKMGLVIKFLCFKNSEQRLGT
jgi:hypothetical protein